MSATITDVRRPIEDLDLPQLNQEIRERFLKAEALINKGQASQEDIEQGKRLLEEIDQFEVVRGRKETAEQMRRRVQDGIKQYGQPAERMRHPEPQPDPVLEQRADRRSPGRQFVESAEYKTMAAGSSLFSETYMPPEVKVELKGLQLLEVRALLQGGSTASGGAWVTPDYRPGYVDIRQRQLTVLDLIDRIPTNSDTISYMAETVFTNAAAFTAEATATTGTSGTKPESTLTYERRTATVRTLAHWIPVTNRMLSDAPMIEGIINQRLLLGLDLVLETQILSGNGTGENLTGITNTTNVLTQAIGTDSVLDAVFKAMIKVEVSGLLIPNATVMYPTTFQTIRLARENSATATLGGYLMGPPSQIGANTLWGRPIVESLGVAAGTVIVADWSSQAMNLFDREQSQIRTGYVNDQLIRNMITILAELRAAFLMWRPAGACVITGA